MTRTEADPFGEGPPHLLSVGGYERDVLASRFAGTREQWRQWKRNPEAYEQRAREGRLHKHRAKRYGLTERTGQPRSSVRYDDPSAPLERITDYRWPLFDEDTREWLAHHNRQSTG